MEIDEILTISMTPLSALKEEWGHGPGALWVARQDLPPRDDACATTGSTISTATPAAEARLLLENNPRVSTAPI